MARYSLKREEEKKKSSAKAERHPERCDFTWKVDPVD